MTAPGFPICWSDYCARSSFLRLDKCLHVAPDNLLGEKSYFAIKIGTFPHFRAKHSEECQKKRPVSRFSGFLIGISKIFGNFFLTDSVASLKIKSNETESNELTT